MYNTLLTLHSCVLLYSLDNISDFLEKNDPDLVILNFPKFDRAWLFLNIIYKNNIAYLITLWYPQKNNIGQTELFNCYAKGIDCILETAPPFFLLQAKINGYLARIIIAAHRWKGNSVIRKNPGIGMDKNTLFMDKVYQYLSENHLKKDFSISKMGLDLGMSRTNFYSQIKTATKLSPSRVVMMFRVEIASVLLKENIKNISEIAFDTGFTSSAYFTKCFKEVYQLSPSEYRKSKSTLLEGVEDH